MDQVTKILVTIVIENNKNQTVKKITQGIEKQFSQSQFNNVKLVSVKEFK